MTSLHNFLNPQMFHSTFCPLFSTPQQFASLLTLGFQLMTLICCTSPRRQKCFQLPTHLHLHMRSPPPCSMGGDNLSTCPIPFAFERALDSSSLACQEVYSVNHLLSHHSLFFSGSSYL